MPIGAMQQADNLSTQSTGLAINSVSITSSLCGIEATVPQQNILDRVFSPPCCYCH